MRPCEWMGSVYNLRTFILRYVPEATVERAWESDIVECGCLLADACAWTRIDRLEQTGYGRGYRYEVHLRSGHWALSTSPDPYVAALDALCKATYQRIKEDTQCDAQTATSSSEMRSRSPRSIRWRSTRRAT